MHSHDILVTGGAGFIGSHLVERLLKQKNRVTILDNFSSGNIENIKSFLGNSQLTLIVEDLKKPEKLKHIVKDFEFVFHFAANPEVRVGEIDPKVHFEENILTTFNLLEAIRESNTSKTVVFASTSTVYGEASQIPTSESYGPLIPISTYGASKLACEALLMSYAHSFNLKALILRLANIIGPRSNHGVIVDFVRKISLNREQLKILGDGLQEKSYICVNDCVDAIIHLTNIFLKKVDKIDIYNIGSGDKVKVKEIAEIVSKEMNSTKIKYNFTGGIDGGRGWKGDVKNMQLSIQKLVHTGWKPKYTSRQAVELATKALIKENLEFAKV
jgi:UDP-glucose 4-epimerase